MNGLTLREIRKLPAAIDVATAARALGVSRASLYASLRDGTCPVEVLRVGSAPRILTWSVLAVLEGTPDSKTARPAKA